jgi:tRNA-5-methyluridine54 2-sulfurtransferase
MQVMLRQPDRTVEVPGPASVARVLERLDLNPETVLVIHRGTLVTKDVVLDDDAEVEIRPVISGGSGASGAARCTRCGEPAVIEIARHNAAYCAADFVDHVRTQVREAISRHRLLSYDDRILVAVSGGKDSLALWDVLLDMGYRADGVCIGLGIGTYSERSSAHARAFAERRGAHLVERDLAAVHGFAIPQAANGSTRSPCGACGISKRYVLNEAARDGAHDVLATGHNLDDEAATLLGNVLRWQTPLLGRQSVALPARPGLVRKVKPLYRLSERETAAYCVIRGIDYLVEECPMVSGSSALRHKAALDLLERDAPGTKAAFLFGFLDRVRDEAFGSAADVSPMLACSSCAGPTSAPRGAPPDLAVVCAFCRIRLRAQAVT